MPKKQKNKTDPVETRLRQVLTALLHDMDPEGDLDKGAVVDALIQRYGEQTMINLEAYLALTIRELDAEEDEDDGDEDEDDGEED